MIKNFLVKATLVLFGLVLSFLIGEVLFRITGADKRPLFQRSDIPGLVYEFVPLTQGRTRGNPVKINSFGLRDYEFSLEKPQGTFRILGLGDSFTYGEGVALEETFLKRLEKMLNELRGPLHYQTINAGCPAYNTIREKIYLEARGMNFEPDLVIVNYLLGDPQERLLHPPAYKHEKGIKGLILRIALLFRKGSYLFDFISGRLYYFWQKNFVGAEGSPVDIAAIPLRPVPSTDPLFLTGETEKKIKGKVSPDIQYTLFHSLYDRNGIYWPKCEQAMAEIAQLCREKRIPVVLVIWPNLVELNGTHPYLDLYQQAAETAREYGMEVLELFPLFKGRKTEELWVSHRDSHPGARAHQLAAEEIYNYLLERNLIRLK